MSLSVTVGTNVVIVVTCFSKIDSYIFHSPANSVKISIELFAKDYSKLHFLVGEAL